jgi:hypothetical protein
MYKNIFGIDHKLMLGLLNFFDYDTVTPKIPKSYGELGNLLSSWTALASASFIREGVGPRVSYAFRMYAHSVSGAKMSTTAIDPMSDSQKSVPIVPWLRSWRTALTTYVSGFTLTKS